MIQAIVSSATRDAVGGAQPPTGVAPPTARSVLLALEADAVLAFDTMLWSRPMHLTALLAVAMVGMPLGVGDAPSVVGAHRLMLAVAGSIGGVAGAVVFGSGAAVHALRRAGASTCTHACGRAIGVSALLAPVVMTLVVVLRGVAPGIAMIPLAATGWFFGLAVAGAAATIAPHAGASSAAVLALGATWLGFLTPSAMRLLVGGWIPIGDGLLWFWNTLPLAWRAQRLGVAPSHGMILGAWIVVGFFAGAVGAVATSPRRLT